MTGNEATLSSGQVTSWRPERVMAAVTIRLLAAALLIGLAMVGLGQLLTHAWQHSGLVGWDGSVERWFAAIARPAGIRSPRRRRSALRRRP